MTRAARIYRDGLYSREYGLPMWMPEPNPSEVLVGDVGYVEDDGSWIRLFNVLEPIDGKNNRGDVPDGFQPLDYNTDMRRRKDGIINPTVMCSSSIVERTVQAHLFVSC